MMESIANLKAALAAKEHAKKKREEGGEDDEASNDNPQERAERHSRHARVRASCMQGDEQDSDTDH